MLELTNYILDTLEKELLTRNIVISNEMKKDIVLAIYKHIKNIMITELIIDNIYHVSNIVKITYTNLSGTTYTKELSY